MIATLLSPEVAVAVAGPEDGERPLLGSEAELVSGAVPSRRRQFTAGRACTRRALAALGCPPGPILRGEDRRPRWPDGFVGSITHTTGYCAAAAARVSDYASLGIDAEQRADVDPKVVARFTTERERARGLTVDGAELPLLWFSAKEAFFKAWSQAGGSWIDYLDGEVELGPHPGQLTVTLPAEEQLGGFAGRFAITAEHVFTAVAMRHGDRPDARRERVTRPRGG